jgi:hypothetical protein
MNRVSYPVASGVSAVSTPPVPVGPSLSASGRVNSVPRVLLLGGCRLVRDDCSLRISRGSQRLLAFLALQDRAVRRDLAAGLLWPDVSEDRARGSLRSALARFGEIARRHLPPLRSSTRSTLP